MANYNEAFDGRKLGLPGENEAEGPAAFASPIRLQCSNTDLSTEFCTSDETLQI
jgi:hypothetical protein